MVWFKRQLVEDGDIWRINSAGSTEYKIVHIHSCVEHDITIWSYNDGPGLFECRTSTFITMLELYNGRKI